MTSKKIQYKSIFIILIGCIFLIQPILQTKFGMFSYFDEFIAIMMLLEYILNKKTKSIIKKNEAKVFLSIFLIFLIGIIGNMYFKYQTGITPIIWDAFNCFKVFITLLGSIYYINTNCDTKYIVIKISSFIRLLVILALICWVISSFKNIGMMSYYDIRYGFPSYKFIYSAAGVFALYLYIYLFVQTIELKYYPTSLRKKFFIFLTLFLMLTTLRTRAIAFILVYIYMLFKIYKKQKFVFRWYHIIFVLICFTIIGIDSFQLYFGNDHSARGVFATKSIVIMKENFPIGSGFATFGTDVAHRYYSALYYKYNMNTIYGLSETNGQFSHDTFWPAIIAQFGILGTLFYILLLYRIYKTIYKRYNTNKFNYLAINYITIVTVVSSIATAIYFNFATVGLFFMIPLLSGTEEKET